MIELKRPRLQFDTLISGLDTQSIYYNHAMNRDIFAASLLLALLLGWTTGF